MCYLLARDIACVLHCVLSLLLYCVRVQVDEIGLNWVVEFGEIEQRNVLKYHKINTTQEIEAYLTIHYKIQKMIHHSLSTGEKSHIRTLLSSDPLTSRLLLNCRHVTNDVCPRRGLWHLGVVGQEMSHIPIVLSDPHTTRETMGLVWDWLSCRQRAQLLWPVSMETHCPVLSDHTLSVLFTRKG